MAVKSAYRTKLADNTPSVEVDDERIQPSAKINIDFATTPKPAPLLLDTKVMEVDKSKEELLPAEPDEATLALQKQLADLKKSANAA
jgi:hypothetical protein